MKYFFTTSLLLLAANVFAQDTTYYDASEAVVTDKALATSYEIVEFKGNSDTATVRTYLISGKMLSESNYLSFTDSIKTLHGITTRWNDNGQKIFEGNYKEGKHEGQLLTYWDNGQLKRNDTYKDGKLINGKCYTQEGKDTAYYDYEIMPQFPGGDEKLFKFLGQNVKYPPYARESSIMGRVYVRFIVEKDGTLNDIDVVRSPHKSLSDEALRVVQLMPKWKPGMRDGKPVRVKYFLPIQFTLK